MCSSTEHWLERNWLNGTTSDTTSSTLLSATIPASSSKRPLHKMDFVRTKYNILAG
jgi:hypothetical protein